MEVAFLLVVSLAWGARDSRLAGRRLIQAEVFLEFMQVLRTPDNGGFP
jgi:hypothetical protein